MKKNGALDALKGIAAWGSLGGGLGLFFCLIALFNNPTEFQWMLLSYLFGVVFAFGTSCALLLLVANAVINEIRSSREVPHAPESD